MAVHVHATCITTNQQQHKIISYQCSPSFTARKIRSHKICVGQIWCKKEQSRRKSNKAKMVSTCTTFAYQFTLGCQFESLCGIFHLCHLFNFSLHFFAPFALSQFGINHIFHAVFLLITHSSMTITFQKGSCTGPLFGLVIKEELLRMYGETERRHSRKHHNRR